MAFQFNQGSKWAGGRQRGRRGCLSASLNWSGPTINSELSPRRAGLCRPLIRHNRWIHNSTYSPVAGRHWLGLDRANPQSYSGGGCYFSNPLCRNHNAHTRTCELRIRSLHRSPNRRLQAAPKPPPIFVYLSFPPTFHYLAALNVIRTCAGMSRAYSKYQEDDSYLPQMGYDLTSSILFL